MKIHDKLEEQCVLICEAAEACSAPVSYHPTKNPKAALIYSSKNIALLTIKEHPDHWLAQPYKVDIDKWVWAEEEGFSREDIWKDKKLQEMIFLPTTRKNLYKHLGIS